MEDCGETGRPQPDYRDIPYRHLRKKTLLAMAFSAIPLIGTWAAVSGYLPYVG